MKKLKGVVVFALLSLFIIGLLAGVVSATPTQDPEERKQAEVVTGCEYPGIDMGLLDPEFSLTEMTYEQPELNSFGPTRASVDLAITRVWVIASQTGQTSHYPGQLCTINVTIYNYGTNPASGFTVVCAVNDYHGNSTILSKVVSNPIAAYQNGIDNITIQFQYTPPLIPPSTYSYPHNFKIVCTVIIANDGVQSNNQRSTTLGIFKADFKPGLKVGQYIKPGGWVDPTGYDPVVAEVGQTLTVPFFLSNDGSGQDSIQIVTDDKPTNWTVGGFSPIDLDDGENTTDDLFLIVKISKYKQDALQGFDYIIRLRAYSLNYPLAETELEIHFSIDFAAGILLNPPYTEKWSPPGAYLNIEVKLTNKGNGKDSFFSSLEPLRDISKKQGWNAYIDAGTLTPAINRDESVTVRIRVSVPPNVMRGAHAKITLITKSNKAASTLDPVERSVAIEVYASRLYNPVLESQKPSYDINPGEESLVYFNLTNMGNGRDPTIEVLMVSQPEGWVTGLDLSEIPETGLGFMTTAEIGLKIILPPDVPARDGYVIRIEAWSGDPLFKNNELGLIINVREKFEVAITAPTTMKTGFVGGIVEYSANIQNKGNVEDTFFLETELHNSNAFKGWEIELSDAMVNLSANMTKSIIVYVSIPLNASADTNLATSSIFEGYYITLSVISQSDPVNASRTQQFITKVSPVYSFIMQLGEKSAKVSGDRNDIVPFNIEITNTGNIKDIVDFRVESDHKFHTLITIHKYIPYRETRIAVLQIEPKRGLDSGVYDFDFIGTSRGDYTFTQKISISVEVVSFNFKVENIMLYDQSLLTLKTTNGYNEREGYKIDAKDTILVRADITNDGDEDYIAGPYGDILITFYDGQIPIIKFRTNLSYLNAGESKTVSLLWNTTVSVEEDKAWELHRLKIMVDSGDHIPENNEDDNWAFVYVNVTGRAINSGDDTGPWEIVWKLIIPLGISLIIVVFVFLTLYIISTVRIEYVDTGYDEDGDYVPFADQYDAFEGEEEVVEEEEELEIEYDADHPYSTSSPYQVSGAAVNTPYSLPPASPYATVAEQTRYALPPAASESSEGSGDIYGFLPEGEVEGTATPEETQASVESVDTGTTPVGAPVTTTKPPVTTKPAVTTKPPATISTRPAVTTTKPPGTVTTKPPATVTTKPPATVTTAPTTTTVTKPPATVTTAPATTTVTKPPATVTTAPATTTVTKPPATVTTAPATTTATKPPATVTSAPTTTTTTKPPESAGTPSLKDIIGGNSAEKKDDKPATSLKDLLENS